MYPSRNGRYSPALHQTLIDSLLVKAIKYSIHTFADENRFHLVVEKIEDERQVCFSHTCLLDYIIRSFHDFIQRFEDPAQ